MTLSCSKSSTRCPPCGSGTQRGQPSDDSCSACVPSGNSPADAAADGRADAPGVSSDGDGISGACPIESVGATEASAKIGAAAYWRAVPTQVSTVIVWLQDDARSGIPGCPGDNSVDARCDERNGPLLSRQRENAAQISCLLDGLGFRLSVAAAYYESPFHLTSGQPVPVLAAFNVGLDWTQIQRLARSPLVSRIDPAPGEAARTGFVPPLPADCPGGADGAAGTGGAAVLGTDVKVVDIASIKGKGRQPVVIEVRDEGVLPRVVTCTAKDAGCPEETNSLWERTILNTREITCLKRQLDRVVAAPSLPVPYGEVRGGLLAPPIPPLDQAPGVLKAFGAGLTFEEGEQLAQHPYVERLWTSSGIQFEQPIVGCPPNLTAPIPPTLCPAERVSAAGKIGEALQRQFTGDQMARFEVMILVAGGAHHCPLPACSQVPCAEREAWTARWSAENLESQHCVRALIESIGGTSSAEVFSIVNAFAATLTWSQIQTVASHPHVVQIDPATHDPPPD